MKKTEDHEPKYIPSKLNNQMINYRVYYMSAIEKILYTLLVLIVGGIVGLVFYGGLFKSGGEKTLATHISNVVVFFGIGLIAVKVFIPTIQKSLKNKRDKTLRNQFQNFLDSLVTSLSSGNTLTDAFSNAYKDLGSQYTEKDFIMKELKEILVGITNGFTLESMLLDFGDRSDSEDIHNFSNIIGNCYRLGGDFKSVVRKTRDIIGDKIAIADEVETKISSNKLQQNAMSFMPVVIVALLKTTNSSFAEHLASLVGVVITTISVGIFIGAYFWGRKIIDIG